MAAAGLDGNLKLVFSRLAKAALVLLAILMACRWSASTSPRCRCSAARSASGWGFGLQKIASNYVSGFIILLDRSIRIGNVINVDKLPRRGDRDHHPLHGAAQHDGHRVHRAQRDADRLRGAKRNLHQPAVRVAVTVQVSYALRPRAGDAHPGPNAPTAHPRVLADPPPRRSGRGFGDSAASTWSWASGSPIRRKARLAMQARRSISRSGARSRPGHRDPLSRSAKCGCSGAPPRTKGFAEPATQNQYFPGLK
jgi:hypothetical protein